MKHKKQIEARRRFEKRRSFRIAMQNAFGRRKVIPMTERTIREFIAMGTASVHLVGDAE